VVVDFEGRKIGLEVDGIIGSREVVIKSLSRHYREVEGLIGASILGDGRIALIVDVESMIRRHHHENGSTKAFKAPAWEEASPLPGPSLSAAPAPGAATPEPALETGGAGGEATGAPEAPLEQLAQEIAGPRGRLLEDVHNQGAVEASVSLSQLMGQEVRVSFPESRLVPIRDVAATMGGEEGTVGGLYICVQGDLEAGMLLVIPEENLRLLNDLLNRAPAGTTIDLAGVDLSGITELGNILASSFINAIADASHLSLKPEVPEASVDMCLSVIDSVLARFNQPGDRILVTEAVIYGSGSESVVCHQVLFLEPPSLRRLMDALAARSAGGLAASRAAVAG
jgi:chemotaxis protein CheC